MASAPYLDGWHAHKDGIGADENPYNERTQQASFSQWSAGWCLRFQRAKHDQNGQEDFDNEYGEDQ